MSRKHEPDYATSSNSLILELVATVLALVTGWLGGELVHHLRMAVDDGAHLDAPSSLSGQTANESSSRRKTR